MNWDFQIISKHALFYFSDRTATIMSSYYQVLIIFIIHNLTLNLNDPTGYTANQCPPGFQIIDTPKCQ